MVFAESNLTLRTARYSTALLGGDGEDKTNIFPLSDHLQMNDSTAISVMIAKWFFSTSINGLMKGINTDSDKLFSQALKLHDKRGFLLQSKDILSVEYCSSLNALEAFRYLPDI